MQTIRVLLADDHESFRRILSSFLETQEGIRIVGEAADGRQAVKKAEHLNPDLILMDIHMPGQNGIEAAKKIKKHVPAARVYILSMDVSEVCRENVKKYADGFIPKSSIKNALLSILSFEREYHERVAGVEAAAA